MFAHLAIFTTILALSLPLLPVVFIEIYSSSHEFEPARVFRIGLLSLDASVPFDICCDDDDDYYGVGCCWVAGRGVRVEKEGLRAVPSGS